MPILLQRIDEPARADHPLQVTPHHCGLSVPDLEASIAWYREMLGFSLEIRQEMPHLGIKGAFLKRGDFRIELFEVPGAAPLPEGRKQVDEDLRTHGTKHMALTVPDVDSALAYLQARGVQVAMPRMEVDGTIACYIKDNSGILIELAQRFPEPGAATPH